MKGKGAEVHAWSVSFLAGSDSPNHSTRKECVFLTDGVDLGQLQQEVELRYSVGGRNVDILEIKALGAIGNCKT